MSTYAIGDVQGCYAELCDLLAHIAFNPSQDKLWFAGDLVNRGPNSLAVLRLIKNLGNAVVVLGNHDLHLLAIANGHPFKDHTMQDVLAAPDRDELINWLRQQPLFYYDATHDYALVHAGLPPEWDITAALLHAAEVEQLLRSPNYADLLEHLYGDKPDHWDPELAGWARLRFIANALTRIRFCRADGKLNFSTKGEIGSQPPGYQPWFTIPNRASRTTNILFGHWAALEGQTHTAGVYALDTGCVWGRSLTALRLEDSQRFSVPARRSGHNKT